MHQHIEIETQLAYYNDLTQGARDRVNQHLQTCFHCRALLETYQTMDRQLALPTNAAAVLHDGLAVDVHPPQRPAIAKYRPAWLDDWLHRLTHPQRTPIPVAGAAITLAFLMLLAASSIMPLGVAQRLMISTPTAVAAELAFTRPSNGIVADAWDGTTLDSSEPITITFGCVSHLCSPYQPAAERFHQLHPDIHVEFIHMDELFNPSNKDFDSDAIAKAVATAADTSANWFTQQSNADQYFVDLTPFIESDDNIHVDDYYPGVLEIFQWHGGTWALPSGITPQLISYNKTAFDEVGLPYPDVNWTQEDFLSLAQQLTQRSGDAVDRYGFIDYSGIGKAVFVHVPAVARLAGLTDGMTSAGTAADELTAAVRWYTDLALRHGVMPNLAARDKAHYTLIRDGRAAMWTDSLNVLLLLPEGNSYTSPNLPFESGFAPIPSATAKAQLAWGPGYFLSRQSTQPQASWLWLEFLSRYRAWGNQESIIDLPGVSARRSITDESGFWDRWSEADRRAIEYVLENAMPQTALLKHPSLTQTLDKAIDDVLAGEPLDEALAETQLAYDEQLRLLAEQAAVTVENYVVIDEQPVTKSSITAPAAGATVSGTVSIMGTAIGETFQKYELYFKRAADGDDGYIWFAGGTRCVVDGELSQWQASSLPPGAYSLRLRVVARDGNYVEYYVPNLNLVASQ